MESYTSRISVAGVVASTAGSLLAAGTVLMSASLALANPNTNASDVGKAHAASKSQSGRLPGMVPQDSSLDLPVHPAYVQQQDGLDAPVVRPYDKRNWRLNVPRRPAPPAAPPAPPAQQPEGQDPADAPQGPAPEFFGESIATPTNSIVYVIDNSGSMSVTVDSFVDENGQIVQGTRLDRAKAELRRSIGKLPETVSFNVLFFDECVMTCWTDKRKATQGNKDEAFAWINNVQPDGWTNTGLGVATALGDKSNTSVVLLSDGAPNFMDCAMNYVGSYQQHRDLIQQQNTQGARIDCFGIGVSTDPDARTFMREVASDSGGVYTEIN